MTISVCPADLTTVINATAPSHEVFLAIERLRKIKVVDVRVIAARGCVENRHATADWLKHWIENEGSREVRSWLYIALSRNYPKVSKAFLKQKRPAIPNANSRELIFIIAAQAMAHRSRYYLLELMTYIFSRNANVSSEAVDLCRMLIDAEDDVTSKFIDILELR